MFDTVHKCGCSRDFLRVAGYAFHYKRKIFMSLIWRYLKPENHLPDTTEQYKPVYYSMQSDWKTRKLRKWSTKEPKLIRNMDDIKYENFVNSDLVFALTKSIIAHATITHKQNHGFALVLVHSYTIICPTTVEKDVSMRYSVCFPPRNKHSVTNWGNSDHYVNDVLNKSTRQK